LELALAILDNSVSQSTEAVSNNRVKVCSYLIPIKILLGVLPSKAFLAQLLKIKGLDAKRKAKINA
jgi:hypothetical protein